ncbi:universal stress protein [Methylobacterium sp. EM32]|uniref:universal stress protein n=1 Tax=Methylobacterium sp. EM32 TaxID=3163481 RepID=UPI0033B4D1A4
MSITTVMVPLDLTPASWNRLDVARSIAERVSAQLIGVSACEALPSHLYGKGALINARIIDRGAARASAELAEVEAVFLARTWGMPGAAWRARPGDLRVVLAEQARIADLVVLGRADPDDVEGWCAALAPGELILQLGCPVLLVPSGVASLAARRVVIGWKDSREARRAVRDSLPLLVGAESVCIATVGPDATPDGAEDVAASLTRCGVAETTVVRSPSSRSVAACLMDIAHRTKADLIVTGAYGHSRLHERVFGSVTRQLLGASPVCCLMSH